MKQRRSMVDTFRGWWARNVHVGTRLSMHRSYTRRDNRSEKYRTWRKKRNKQARHSRRVNAQRGR